MNLRRSSRSSSLRTISRNDLQATPQTSRTKNRKSQQGVALNAEQTGGGNRSQGICQQSTSFRSQPLTLDVRLIPHLRSKYSHQNANCFDSHCRSRHCSCDTRPGLVGSLHSRPPAAPAAPSYVARPVPARPLSQPIQTPISRTSARSSSVQQQCIRAEGRSRATLKTNLAPAS